MITRTSIFRFKDQLGATLSNTVVEVNSRWPKPTIHKPRPSTKSACRNPVSTPKRCFDLIVATVGIVFAAPIMLCIAILILLKDGRPIFFVSERMKTPTTPFQIIKFRTMSTVPDNQNVGVTGGDKTDWITPTGCLLRKYRLDELPQFLNILRGDMSFIGPRPPLRQYTEAYPETYGAVLKVRPGVTGLATLHFHRYEERLIARSNSPAETEAIYTTRCIPRKATLDLIYQRHASVWFDVIILWQTVLCMLKR